MIKEIYYLNEKGLREINEDSIFPTPGNANITDKVFVVCDGVGGESFGEVASKIVSEKVGTILSQSDKYSKCIIQNAITEAIKALNDYASINPSAKNMSTTLSLVCIQKDGILISWCGDSRIYHIRDGKILWKSKDHSLVQQLLDSGQINDEEAKNHPRKNIILKSISRTYSSKLIDIKKLNYLIENDYILICSDGILESVGENEIYKMLEPNQLITNKSDLFFNFCEHKSKDNYSMYLLKIDKGFKNHLFKNYKLKLFIVFILLAFFSLYLIISINRKPIIEQFHNHKSIYTNADSLLDDSIKKINPDSLVIKP